MRVGVISDTHGLLRPEAVTALLGVELIVHAGDIGGAEILEQLRMIAPVEAVRGNNDKGPWAHTIAETAMLQVRDRWLYVIHDRKELDIDPSTVDVLIAGHSHEPVIETIDGTLFLNPGSAGPRRFSLPICLAILTLDARGARAELVDLEAK